MDANSAGAPLAPLSFAVSQNKIISWGKQMRKAIWLSYDLGVKGDYEGLYAWLDDLEAKECGDSLAFFNYEIDDDRNLIEKIKEDIENNIALTKRDRIYIIFRSAEKKLKGKFIFGKRKSAPWTGYGTKSTEIDEDF